MKHRLYNGLLVAASLVFACLLLELALRLVGYVPAVVPPYLYDNHAHTWWTVRPNYSETVRTPDGSVTYAINAQGIRAAQDIPLQFAATSRRIFLIGDSYTFGQGIDEKYTFARVLEDSLRSRQMNVEVINLGVPGFGTMHAYYRLTEYAELLGIPDLVIYAFTANDPVDNISGKKEVVNGIRIDAHRRYKRLLSYLGHLHFHSRLAGVVLTRLYPFFNPRIEKLATLQSQGGPIEKRADFLATSKYLEKMRDWTYDNQAGFAVLVNNSSEYSLPLRRLLEQTGTATLEADQFFASCNPSREPVHLLEGHWNALAHACVARGIETYLLTDAEWNNRDEAEAR